ncbi:odorant receptor 30a-like isoform X2 [Polyergus mexicanus]|uniref:odorant receptor 30a-like isoform X2 n=1 Tax=Polyergus mexicanus TaxID=615972 RepID=UPI0038B4D897
MISIQTQHFNFHRIFLLAVGLWPYQQSWLVKFQLVLFFSIQISFILFQLTVFISAKCTPDLVIKVLSIVLLLIMYAIEYNSFRMNAQAVRCLFEQLQHICNELKDENEIAIIKKYGNNAKRYAAILMLLYICITIIMFLLPILPRLLGFVLHINATQPRVMQQLMPNYIIDQGKHFYLILLYMYAALLIGATALVGIGMTLLSYLKHACGMFRIASYRIEKAITMWTNTRLENEIIIYKEIAYAVDIHCKAINFRRSHILLISVGVICLTLNLYAIAVNASHGGDVEQLLLHFLIAVIIFLYLFLANYAGQEITDHNDYVYFTAYTVRWYTASVHVQKLILFLLQRGSKTFSLNFGGVVSLSLELFAALTKASLSYFTVIYSMQQ